MAFRPLFKASILICLQILEEADLQRADDSFPGGIPHMKGVGMLVGNFELNGPKGEQCGRGPSFF